MSAMLSDHQEPLADHVEPKKRAHCQISEKDDAGAIKAVELEQRVCSCPGLASGANVVDTVDVNLGHSLAYGGGYGHSMVKHLRSVNPFPLFDAVLRFVDHTHTYYYKKVAPYFEQERKINSSTTAVISQYFEKFDVDATLQRMRKKGRMDDPKDEYYQMSDDDIRRYWTKNGENASGAGTDMHECIERFLNNARRPGDPEEDTNQFELFQIWHIDNMLATRELPFRTELCMFDEEHEMAGMCDLVSQPEEWAKDPERRHWINLKDWKHTQKCNWQYLPYTNHAERVAKDPRRMFVRRDGKRQFRADRKSGRSFPSKPAKGHCAELVDCEASKYFIQLNVYKWMIGRNSKFRVQSMQIVAFHQDNTETIVIEVPDLQHIVEKMMADRRREMLARYEAELALTQQRIRSLREHPTRPSGSAPV